MEWYVAGALIAALLVVLMVNGLPVGVSLGVVSIIFLADILGMFGAARTITRVVFEYWSSYELLSLPLFVLMGNFLFAGGTAKDIFDLAAAWGRRVPGGLAFVTIATSAVFAALSGSTTGALATIGIVTIPEMLRRGYDKQLAVGAVGAAGGLAHLIPPSTLMVLYASVMDLHIGRTLMAGLIPGLILAAGYSVVAMIWALAKPEAAPKEPPVSWGERMRVMKNAIGPLVLVAAVSGTVFFGIATATEAAALGVITALLLGAVSRRMTWANFRQALRSATRATCFIMLIGAGGSMLSWVLSYYQIPAKMVELTLALEWNRWAVMILIQLMYIVLGAFINPIGMIIVTMPIVGPLVSALGFDLIWFAVLLMINIEMAVITPPFGIAIYIIQGIVPKGITFWDILRGCLIYCVADVTVMALVMIFPQLALWLPTMMAAR